MMKLQFGCANTRITEKYNGRDNPCDHLVKWAKAWETKLQPKWVHIIFHTLDTITMNFFMETELHHGTTEWDVLKDKFLLTFSFEDRFLSIDEALQEIKVVIFRTGMEPMEWTQLD